MVKTLSQPTILKSWRMGKSNSKWW